MADILNINDFLLKNELKIISEIIYYLAKIVTTNNKKNKWNRVLKF